MTGRQTAWPREWLMTDERLGDRLWRALEHLPDGRRSGIVVRHYSLARAERARIALRIAQICRSRAIVLAIGADEDLAWDLGADLVHNPRGPGALPFSRSVHSMDEALAARDAGAALVFISPVHRTLSHPDQAPLGPVHALELARAAAVPAIALGGMTERNFATLEGGFHGWAGIGAWDKAPD